MSTYGYKHPTSKDYLVVRTGMPEQLVSIGRGTSLVAALDDLDATPIQSAARSINIAIENGVAWAVNAGWITSEEWDEMEEIDPERVEAAIGRLNELGRGGAES